LKMSNRVGDEVRTDKMTEALKALPRLGVVVEKKSLTSSDGTKHKVYVLKATKAARDGCGDSL
jgi:hypothetical protein